MALSAHLEQLSIKHTALETQIQQELRNPHPDDLRISKLKKEKLHIKDELESYETSS
ncbi:YdcH family protein [Hellea sp.]|nr:YdcH family protein [Hellea sp.]